MHIQCFYRDRLDVGSSASTVHKMHDILRLGIAQAAKVGQAVRMNRNSLDAHMRPCLDSNQGPLPYQRSVMFCQVFPEFAKCLQTVVFSP